MAYSRISTFKTIEQFQARLDELHLQLPLDEHVHSGDKSVLAQPLVSRGGLIGNRFCILPMEGWDGTADGKPTELTKCR